MGQKDAPAGVQQQEAFLVDTRTRVVIDEDFSSLADWNESGVGSYTVARDTAVGVLGSSASLSMQTRVSGAAATDSVTVSKVGALTSRLQQMQVEFWFSTLGDVSLHDFQFLGVPTISDTVKDIFGLYWDASESRWEYFNDSGALVAVPGITKISRHATSRYWNYVKVVADLATGKYVGARVNHQSWEPDTKPSLRTAAPNTNQEGVEASFAIVAGDTSSPTVHLGRMVVTVGPSFEI